MMMDPKKYGFYTKCERVEPMPRIPVLVTPNQKPLETHPWQNTIKYENLNKIMRAHNSVYSNPKYPDQPKEKPKGSTIFTVFGNNNTKEFIYCVKMVQGMHKYRPQTFAAPVINGYTTIDWPIVLNTLQRTIGGRAYNMDQVLVLYNRKFLGGVKELKELIEAEYIYHLAINYHKESVDLFKRFVLKSGLYSDICPKTCENFLRLCKTRKGGYSGTPVHRIVEGGWIQCGGFGLKDTPLGCENFIVTPDRRGILGMCNADRDVDCSTQFFVLLQPAEWMQDKFVIFGQLIEGHNTLQKIEEVPTYYESPLKDIIIYRAGILNLECDVIMINRGAVAYIDGHVEDLVSLGEMLIEWLLELVEVEVRSRRIARKQITSEGIPNTTENNKMNQQNNKLTERFVKRNDIGEMMSDELEGEGPIPITPTSNTTKEKKPFYISLTDVPYPDEKDSEFDLKRFLRGDYCLEADLDPKQNKILANRKLMKKSHESHEISDLFFEFSVSDSYLQEEQEDEEIQEFQRNSSNEVSFSGKLIKMIAAKHIKKDLYKNPRSVITDEELRRARMTAQELKDREKARVSIAVSPWETHTPIKRRQTGYFPKKQYEEDDDDYDDEEANHRDSLEDEASDLAETNSSSSSRFASLKRNESAVDTHKITEHEEKDNFKLDKESRVKISEENKHQRRPTGYYNTNNRKSVGLTRLFADVDTEEPEDDQHGPTLKHYKPKDHMKKEHFMLSSQDTFIGILLKRNQKLASTSISLTDEVPVRTHIQSSSFRLARKKESMIPECDYVRPMDSKFKKRPSMSVAAYQEMNKRASMKRTVEEDPKAVTNTPKPVTSKSGKKCTQLKLGRGLRLPGDTPIHSAEEL